MARCPTSTTRPSPTTLHQSVGSPHHLQPRSHHAVYTPLSDGRWWSGADRRCLCAGVWGVSRGPSHRVRYGALSNFHDTPLPHDAPPIRGVTPPPPAP